MIQAPGQLGPARLWPVTVRAWPFWRLRAGVRCYLLAVIAGGVAAAAWLATTTRWRAGDLAAYALLLAMGAITVESVRRAGEPGRPREDAHGAWELAAAILLPPVFALCAPVMMLAFTQVRARRASACWRVFSAAATGLAGGAASAAFHAAWAGPLPAARDGLAGWLALATACGLARYAAGKALTAAALRLAGPASCAREVLGGADGLYNDAAELCVGILVALAAALTLTGLLAAIPCGAMLQRSASHARLLRAARTDAKTGLLTATAWQREAAAQVDRARRTRSPLAVALIDVDRFKQVNDVHGHLAGDAVLVGIARELTAGLRPYDLAGRFGGEEFCLVMPDSGAAEAFRAAERTRIRLGNVTIPAGAGRISRPGITVTVSIGVAVLSEEIGDLTGLLAAADSALYQAKRGGRNLVRLAGTPLRGGRAGGTSRFSAREVTNRGCFLL